MEIRIEKSWTKKRSHFVIENVKPSEIPPPSDAFKKFVREHPDLKYLNSFTLPKFEARVRKAFAPEGKP